MKAEVEFYSNFSDCKNHKLSRKLKATIGYWIDYFYNKYEDSVIFSVFGENITIKDKNDNYYTIFFRGTKFDIQHSHILEILDLLESLLKEMSSDVEES
jgi:hypothetical protein